MEIQEIINARKFEPEDPIDIESLKDKIIPKHFEQTSKTDEDGNIVQVLEPATKFEDRLAKINFRTYTPEFLSKLGNPSVSVVGVSDLETLDKINNISKPENNE